jgi:hypothetical protein
MLSPMTGPACRFPEHFGFRSGDKGTHTSRTIMLDELGVMLAAVPPDGNRGAYIAAAVEDNVLGKSTVATRKLSIQRLSELYLFDAACPLFRVLRRLWFQDSIDRALLALLCALARDPLLRATAEPILAMSAGEELTRQKMTEAIQSVVGDRLNESTLDKVARNTSSSWTQSGHLKGRARKFRQVVKPSPLSTVFALMLGYLEGLRGSGLFDTLWTRVLDVSPSELRQLAAEAKRHGYIDIKIAGEIIEIGFIPILTTKEIQDSRGQN